MSVAAASSDPREFREVYQAHHGLVWHALHRFGLRGPTLEDALQDVFVVAFRRRDALSGSSKAWLYAIARRVASNYRRSARRHDARTDALAQALSAPRAPVPEAIVALDRYLDTLSPEDRELFVLSEVEGMTGPEIAAAWGRNVNTVYARIRKLRNALHDEGVARRARRQRPRASAHAWALLLPTLQPAAAGVALSAWAVAAVAAGVVATVAVTHRAEPPPVERASAPAPAPVVAEPPPTVSAAALPAPTPSDAPVATPAARMPAPVARPRPSRVEPRSTLREENALLERAREHLRQGDPAAAMRVVAEHGTDYPDSALADVRTVVRIEALCALGKDEQARGEARVFLESRPSTTARRRVEKSCAAPSQKLTEPDMTGA